MSPFYYVQICLCRGKRSQSTSRRFNPETAALAFLQKLTALGYAEFILDDGELEICRPEHTTANNEVKK